MTRSPRPVALGAVLACLFAVALGGCARGTASNAQNQATDEGTYLEAGGLKYQIQISRYLNPSDGEDHGYLIGLPPGEKLGTNDIWFGIFMRVENDGDRPAAATSNYTITDTQGNTFHPVPLGASNVFAYRAHTLPPGGKIPAPDSSAGQGPIQGSLLLFKLNQDDLQNRPLVLHINPGAPTGQTASVEIDL